jgi:hypothetical protein
MKAIGWILGILVLALVGVAIFLVLNSGDLVKDAIEKYGSRYLETDVSVSRVNLSLAEGSGEILDLNIDNPQGFDAGTAFALGQIKIVLDPSQITADLIVLKEVTIDAAQLAAVVRGRTTNLQGLMDNLNKNVGTEESSAEEETAPGPKLIIDRFQFTNAQASVDSDLAGQFDLSIPDINLKDVGRSTNGATAGEVMQQILKPVIKAVTREMVNQGLDIEGAKAQLQQNLQERASEKLGTGFKGLTDKLRGREE